MLRLSTGLNPTTSVILNVCTPERQALQVGVLKFDVLQVTKFKQHLSKNRGGGTDRKRDFTSTECAVLLMLVKALVVADLLCSLHLFSAHDVAARRSPKKGDTSLAILNVVELQDACVDD